jgi:hypothetical protein
MEALGADRVVVVRDAVVIALALVQRHEKQLGLALRQCEYAGLKRRPSLGCEPTDGCEHFADCIPGMQR